MIFRVSATIIACILSIEPYAQIEVKDIAKDLTKSDRSRRVYALELLEIKTEFPAELVNPLKRFVELEGQAIHEPFSKFPPNSQEALKSVPHDYKEVSLDRIKSQYADHIGRMDMFVIVDIVRNSSYYNFGMTGEAKDFYAFDFTEISRNGQTELEDAHVYVLRELGDALTESASRAKEEGNKLAIVRLKGYIDAERIEKHEDRALSHLQISDWQFFNPDKEDWEPWALEPTEKAFRFLCKIGMSAIPAIVDLLATDHLVTNTRIDAYRRIQAQIALQNLDSKEVLEALSILSKRIPSTWFERARDWLTSPQARLRQKARTAGPGRVAPKTPHTAATKASTLLGMARNFEKSKKTKAAIEYYQRITKEYSDTAEAKTAQDRLKALGADRKQTP